MILQLETTNTALVYSYSTIAYTVIQLLSIAIGYYPFLSTANKVHCTKSNMWLLLWKPVLSPIYNTVKQSNTKLVIKHCAPLTSLQTWLVETYDTLIIVLLTHSILTPCAPPTPFFHSEVFRNPGLNIQSVGTYQWVVAMQISHILQ